MIDSFKTVTLLGGSFNPVHNGHLAMAESAHKQFGLENIIFMPNKVPYYKDSSVFASDEDRMNMLRLAVKPYPYMTVSDMEIKRGGETHTIDTVRELRSEGVEKLFFIIGGDSLEWLDKWYEADQLFRYVTFLTAVREDMDREKSLEKIDRIRDSYPTADIRLLNLNAVDVSSSDIRRRAAEALPLTDLVPKNVESYILENGLYKGGLTHGES